MKRLRKQGLGLGFGIAFAVTAVLAPPPLFALSRPKPAPVTAKLVWRPIFDDAISAERRKGGRDAESAYRDGLTAYEQGDFRAAEAAILEAIAERPGDRRFWMSLGYARLKAGALGAAEKAFRRAALIDEDAAAWQEAAYAGRRLGHNREAAQAFRNGLATLRREGPAEPRTEYRLRSEIAALENPFDAVFYSAFRLGSGEGGAIDPSGRTTSQSQGGAEASARLPGIGFRNGRTVTLFGRVLWGYEGAGLRLREDSLQGGVGLRVKPFSSHNLALSAERLFSLGAAARDDWMARLSFSWDRGASFDPFASGWTYLSFYGDVALVLPGDLYLSGEIRAGRTFRLGGRWALTPHLLVAAARREETDVVADLFEAGSGLSLKLLFRESEYHAFRASAEILLQYRGRLGGHRPDDSSLAATMVMSF